MDLNSRDRKQLLELSALNNEYQNGNYLRVSQKLKDIEHNFQNFYLFWYLFALNCVKLGHYDRAKKFFSKAVDLEPDSANLVRDIAIFYKNNNELVEAAKYALRYVELKPSSSDAYCTLGLVHLESGELNEAEQCFLDALKLNPEDENIQNNFAKLYMEKGDFNSAIRVLERVLKTSKDNIEAKINLSLAYRSVNHLNKSLSIIGSVTTTEWNVLDNRSKEQFKFNRSLAFLASGNCDKGWEDYLDRFKAPKFTSKFRNYEIPRLECLSKAFGNKLLIWPEQGIGDQLTFLALINEFQKVTASDITLLCDPRMKTLLSRSFENVHILTDPKLEINCQQWDYHLPLGDIAPLMKFSKEKTQFIKPYLKVDNRLLRNLKKNLSKKRIRVGLAWESVIKNYKRNLNHTRLSDWAPLIENEDYIVYNLQYDFDDDDLTDCEQKLLFKINRPAFDLKNDFESLSALMKTLDYVICPTTAIMAHAAACGIPTLSYSTIVSDRALGNVDHNSFSIPWFWHNKVYLYTPSTKNNMIQNILECVGENSADRNKKY